MLGLPDIGDPFDVAAFRAFRVPEAEDAFVLLKQAQAKLLSPAPHLPGRSQRERSGSLVTAAAGAPRLAGCAP